MANRLQFSVEDMEIIDENPNSKFAIMSLDFFASGRNLHDMWVSEETLERTAHSIVNCPLVWKYDPILDDIYTHDDDEVPCGFVPESAEVKSRKLDDGRTMLSVVAYVWKKYTGDLMRFFKRDNGKKPVSVEMSVYEMEERPDGLTELKDFAYEAITILGSLVTPAIPLANATVLSFAKDEYKRDYEQEFHKIEVPQDVLNNIQRGLDLKKKNNYGSSPALAFAKGAVLGFVTTEDVRHMTLYFSKNEKDRTLDDHSAKVNWLLYGGDEGKAWSTSIINSTKGDGSATHVTFPYKSMKDVNPSIKGITPPVSLAQANQIAKQADSIGTDEDKNGWAIAISSFKKTHVVKEGKWVKKDEQKEEMSMEEETKDVEMAEEVKEPENISVEKLPEDQKEEIRNSAPEAEEKAEEKSEEKEEEKAEGKSFGYPAGFADKMKGMFAEEDEEEEVKMAKSELEKGEFAEPGVVLAGMFAKMCKMAEAMAQMAKDKAVYMSENEELKKFKAEMEEQKKAFEVEKTLAEMSEKVVLSAEAREDMLSEAKKYSYSNIEEWKTYCKAKSFDFALKANEKEEIIRVGFPFGSTTNFKQKDLWS